METTGNMTLYLAEFGHVFSGQGRLLMYKAPDRRLAEFFANGMRRPGEIVVQVNRADDVTEHNNVTYVDVEYKQKTHPSERRSKKRVIRIKLNK